MVAVDKILRVAEAVQWCGALKLFIQYKHFNLYLKKASRAGAAQLCIPSVLVWLASCRVQHGVKCVLVRQFYS